MNNSKETRYDYFLIWGNGLKYKEDILKEIRAEKSFDVIKVVKHNIKNIKKFVKEIYSYDYAPYQHLKNKTEYLLSTTPEVIFIFVKNKVIDEDSFGENEYKHTESKTVKKMKELIRNKYNERKNERRTENHVVHASDNENQTDYILKYLGYPKGINTFEPCSNIISFSQLNTKDSYTIKKIPISDIYSSIITDNSKNRTEISAIENSPHYKYLCGEKIFYKNYTEKFQGTFLQDDHGIEKFDNLIKSFNYLDEDHSTNYIMVKKLDQDKYLILDGLHRATILKHKGIPYIISAIIE